MNKYITILLLLLSAGARAQERLTLQDAIARTLKHNFDINMADISLRQSIRNNTYGNAGFSPNVFAGINLTESRNNVYSELSNGTNQANPDAVNTSINPALTVNWTIFDGGKMFIVKKVLNQTQALSEYQLKAQIQASVSRTIQMYASVLLQQKQLVAVDTAIFLAKVRMQITQVKFETGAGAKVDYLQARVDFNNSRNDSLTAAAALAQASDSLSVLMGESQERIYVVDDSLSLNTRLQPVDKDRLREINLLINTYRINAQISHLNADIANTYFLPTVSLSGGYGYTRTTTATGFSLYSRNYGPYGTLGVSVPLFEGGNLRRQSKVASLQALRDDLYYEKQNSVIGKQYRIAWRSYLLAVAALDLANENIKYAKENLDVQLARFRLGVGTTLESKEAENSYVLALVKLYTAQYNVKVNETIVLELENQLVKSE